MTGIPSGNPSPPPGAIEPRRSRSIWTPRRLRFFFQRHAIPSVGAGFLASVGGTMRMVVEDHEDFLVTQREGPVLYAFWHDRLFLMPYLFARYQPGQPVVALISRSRDGQVITDIAQKFGIQAARGSSSKRGPAALRELVRSVERGWHIVITPDGPRGPRHTVHTGILQLAQLTQRPIHPVTYHLDRKWTLPSWDRFQIPVPFTRCTLQMKPPIYVPADATPESLAGYGKQLAESLGE